VRSDPGSTLYLDALLANLRRWKPKAKRSWLTGWLGGANEIRPGAMNTAPEQLRERLGDVALLRELAAAAADAELDDIELRYLTEARRLEPDDVATLRQLARCLTRQGRFEEAGQPWQAVLALDSDAEAAKAVEDLQPAARAAEVSDTAVPTSAELLLKSARAFAAAGQFAAAEQFLAMAQQASGGDLAILAEREDLRLAHSQLRLSVARRRAESDPHPKAQSLVGRMEQEHNRLEIDILHIRSERHPHDQRLKLELARRLKRAGNYSGAIQRLEESLADTSLAAEGNLELGECWQHLRQFGKALGYYRRAVELADAFSGGSRLPLTTALYRIGVLAAAMNEPAEAQAALTRLVSIEPDYKDARERLDKLP
jgi:tetratricopeptide (TPR) repeat protein